eukprot:3521063-Prymnesium_polylepis.1
MMRNVLSREKPEAADSPLAESPKPNLRQASDDWSHTLTTSTQTYTRMSASSVNVISALSSGLRAELSSTSQPSSITHMLVRGRGKSPESPAQLLARALSRELRCAHRRNGFSERRAPKKAMLISSATTTRASSEPSGMNKTHPTTAPRQESRELRLSCLAGSGCGTHHGWPTTAHRTGRAPRRARPQAAPLRSRVSSGTRPSHS